MIEALRKNSTAVRIAALGMVERFADPAAYPEVEKLLRDDNPSVRGAAVEAARSCGGARAVTALVKCLRDASWEVRQAASIALGILGESSAVDGLCELVADPDRDVRESVIAALGQIGDRRAIGPLVLALVDVESSVRSSAAGALRKLDRRWEQSEFVPGALTRIKAALEHSDYWVRHSATKLFEELRVDPNNLPPTPAPAPVEHQVEMPVPASGGESLASAPELPAPEPHRALPILTELLFDRDRDLRLAAAGALGRLQDPNAASHLAAATSDPDEFVRHAAQAALAALS
jgi:HEAT repeat protein